MNENNTHPRVIIGIDVAKDKLDICILPKKKHVVIANQRKAINGFIRNIKKKNEIGLVVMEHTGGYEQLAHQLLVEANCDVHVAHPTRVHAFGQQKGYFAKTDHIDAHMLGEFGQQENPEPSPLKSKSEKTLKELSCRRGQLVELLITERCRLKPHLSKEIQRSIKRTIKQLEREIGLVDKDIEKYIDASEAMQETARRLQTFKGVGPTVARGFICTVPELGLLSRAQIACLVGVAPRNKDSGKKKGVRRISGGRSHIRKLLYMSALVAIRFNDRMKKFYERLKAKGKHSKVAIVAVMRKILIVLNSMIKNGKDWQEDFAMQAVSG